MVSDDGDKAAALKRGVARNHFLYLKRNCTWDDLKTLIRRGCTIGRVGQFSEFIAIDIDDSEITHGEMGRWAEQYNRIHGDCVLATPSRSGLWYKHHVFFKVPEYKMEDHFTVYVQCFHRIAEYFGGKRVKYDPKAAHYYQCMYQTGEPGQFTLPDSIQLAWWCKKADNGPVPYVEIAKSSGRGAGWHLADETDVDVPPYPTDGRSILPNNAAFYFNLALMAGMPPKELPELPFELVQASYVRKGERHSAMMKLSDMLVRNAAVSGFFGVAYTEDDARKALESHICRHFEDGNRYLAEDAASIKNAISTIWAKYMKEFNKTDRSYGSLKTVLGKGSHRYGLGAFAVEYMKRHPEMAEDIDNACIVIVDDYNGYPEDYDTATFHKMLSEVREAIKPMFIKRKAFRIEKDLDEARRVYELTKDIRLFDNLPPETPMSFEEFCERSTAGDRYIVEKRDVRVKRKDYKHHKQHRNKGELRNGLLVIDGELRIPRDKITPYIRFYCSKNHYKLVPMD